MLPPGRWRTSESVTCAHVFSYRGKPLRNINADAWQRACTKAGITDFRWHDLRHTWASWHVQNGTSLQELMNWAGGSHTRWCCVMPIWPATT